MTIAIDTNVLVRLLVRDDEAQYAAAQRLVAEAAATGEPVLIVLGVLLEAAWVLRSRYKVDKPVSPTPSPDCSKAAMSSSSTRPRSRRRSTSGRSIPTPTSPTAC